MSKVIETFNKSHIPYINSFVTYDENNEEIPYFQDYLKYSALMDIKQGNGTTQVFFDDEKKKIMGFYTLKCNSLIVQSDNAKIKIGYPALEIYELAIDKDYQKHGVGTLLIKDIIAKAYNLQQTILGIRYIVVCAKSCAVGFYEKNGFQKINDIVPRTEDNKDCIPMSLHIGDIS